MSVPQSLARLLANLEAAPELVDTLLRDAAVAGPVPADPDEADEWWAQLACQNLAMEPAFEAVAVRALLSRLYRQVFRECEGSPREQEFPPPAGRWREGFVRYIRQGVELGELDSRLLQFDLEELARALVPRRDELIPYVGLATLADRYLVRHPETRRILEAPQFLFMRVAMGLALAEPPQARQQWAVRFYEHMSTLRYLPSTPTLFNAGTTHAQLSSCYLSDVLDSMNHILESAVDFGQLAKYAGGIGASITKLRSAGSPVRGINGQSSGIVPFAHMYDALIKAVSQGGRRRGTLALYLEPWHLEIEAFLDLKRNAGDPYLRTPSLNTALWVPDEFLRRVEADEEWYLFDPYYVPELPETFGEAFRAAYERYVQQARAGELPARAFRVVRARELFREILATLQETSHPWITFKDASNVRSMLAGVVHSSNLCTEIQLPTSPDEIAVCNLASVNLARHLTADGQVDWEKLRETVRVAMRGLDNVIDVNFYPVDKARRSNAKNRPVGLGVMGFAEVFARLGMAYGDEASCELTDRVVEFVSYCAIEASCDMSCERGSFPAFPESRWAKGQVPVDT
ncbi:MAG TPA: ribonucleoside-diphosphate reductase subunit alpha, partial [Limnochordales bacterium]